jgi:pyridinium-3,5-bisthiocarboxylic acid mononucleotide nickel chelatase
MSRPHLSAPTSHLLYVDCFSGVSGDMLLGALLDLGLELTALEGELARLPLDGYRLAARPLTSHGVSGTKLDVVVDDAPQPERHLADILRLLDGSGLAPGVRERAAAVFGRLARAEARVHGTSVEEVHFHEVGAVDSIVDVVGAMIGLELLGVERVFASSLPLGGGMVRSQHGRLPLPAPATLELLAEVGAPTRPAPGERAGELVTPTGAAILAELARFEQPPIQVRRVGYGFGTRELPWPNAVRLWLGEPLAIEVGPRPVETLGGLSMQLSDDPDGPLSDEVVLIETNLDDASPELLGYAMERLFEAGALDVAFVPIQMKKNRPGTLLLVVAPPPRARALAELVLAETPTLGVRLRPTTRLVARREETTVETVLGPIRVKLKRLGARTIAAPEYEDCARLARAHNVPLADVYCLAQTGVV